MKIKALFTALILGFIIHTGANAQIKIGYTNIELILAYMPEAKKMDGALQTYQKKLAEKIQIKEQYAKGKLDEYIAIKQKEEQGGTVDQGDLKRREDELMKLDQEIQKLAQDSEFELMAKRQEVLEPILQKLQGAIDKVAETEGYTYILNQTTSAGVSTILYGPEENDVTEKIMKMLNIPIPQE